MKLSKEKEAALKQWQSTPLYLTEEGLRKLKEKLAHLENILPKLISETQRTRAYGDTSDNAEYKDSKMHHRRVQRQIYAIQDQLKKVQIIKPGPSPTGKVQLGSTVLLESKDGKQKTFTILGSAETNPVAGRISMSSPLGASLMGHGHGEKITVKTPRGSEEYVILKVS